MALVRIFFEKNESTLTADDEAALTDLAKTLRASPPARIAIAGNTDSTGPAVTNQALAKLRAEAVRDFLVKQGLAPKTMKLFVNGPDVPAAPNNSEENRRKNRRVDVATASEQVTATSPGDFGEKTDAPPAPVPAQGEVPLLINDTAVGATHPFVALEGMLAPPRTGNDVFAFVDGRDFMADVAQKIRAANEFIYITDWQINPFVHLVRTTSPLQNVDRLIELLQTAAGRGVRVRVMLWDSNKLFVNNRDIEAEAAFERVGVRVHRHRFDGATDSAGNRFSHHQKTIVMDGGRPGTRVSFIGGLDLTAGRWDTPDHVLAADPGIFPDAVNNDASGNPYYVGDFYNSDEEAALVAPNNVAARGQFPRLPWHDVHARIVGPAAFDIERNFVQRWNFEPSEPALTLTPGPGAEVGSSVVQIIRSAGRASIGNATLPRGRTETSIHQAYINAIRMSQHHIYVENQYFTSNFGDGTVQNQVANELAARIIRAIQERQRFRVKIVVPVHAEGVLPSVSTEELMHWQYRTIVRPAGHRRERNVVAPASLIGQVLAALGGVANLPTLHEHLCFYCLRNHGTLPGTGTVVTEQIYVHAKLMIVDDRVAIIGSANINDRSLLGFRDSELSAIILDNETLLIPIDEKNRFVRKFAHELRVRLWQEHLGLSSSAQILDPVASATHELWHRTALSNTRIYETVFPRIPSDAHDNFATQRAAPRFVPADVARLRELKGHLTVWPLDWLRNEDLETTGLDDAVFTFLGTQGNDTAVV